MKHGAQHHSPQQTACAILAASHRTGLASRVLPVILIRTPATSLSSTCHCFYFYRSNGDRDYYWRLTHHLPASAFYECHIVRPWPLVLWSRCVCAARAASLIYRLSRICQLCLPDSLTNLGIPYTRAMFRYASEEDVRLIQVNVQVLMISACANEPLPCCCVLCALMPQTKHWKYKFVFVLHIPSMQSCEFLPKPSSHRTSLLSHLRVHILIVLHSNTWLLAYSHFSLVLTVTSPAISGISSLVQTTRRVSDIGSLMIYMYPATTFVRS